MAQRRISSLHDTNEGGNTLKIRFWGTRGSIPTPGPETAKYGGNTTCVEVRLDDGTLIIFDAGTGIRKLGLALLRENFRQTINLFLTHSHWDHIQGFPFFEPADDPEMKINILGCKLTYGKLREILTYQMESKYFPVNFSDLKADITFKEINPGVHPIGSGNLSFLQLNHPGTAYGFKLEDNSHTLVFLTDNELLPPGQITTDWNTFVQFCRNADVLIHDAMWTREEAKTRAGWGHSSVDQVIKLALNANVKQHLILFHHDPERTDSMLDLVGAECNQKLDSNSNGLDCAVAREGGEIIL